MCSTDLSLCSYSCIIVYPFSSFFRPFLYFLIFLPRVLTLDYMRRVLEGAELSPAPPPRLRLLRWTAATLFYAPLFFYLGDVLCAASPPCRPSTNLLKKAMMITRSEEGEDEIKVTQKQKNRKKIREIEEWIRLETILVRLADEEWIHLKTIHVRLAEEYTC